MKYFLAIFFAICVQNVNAEVNPISSNSGPIEFTSLYGVLGTYANAASPADVHWASASTNTASGWVVTSSNTITAKAAGLFLCNANLQTDQTTGKLTPAIYHNDVLVARGAEDPVTSDDTNAPVQKMIYAAPGDTFKLKVNLTTAGSSITLDNGMNESYFQCGKL